MMQTNTGSIRLWSCPAQWETSRNAGLRMLSDFGLSQKSRRYVQKAPGAKRDNPFAFLDDDFKSDEEKKADQEQFDRKVKEIREKALAKKTGNLRQTLPERPRTER
jgi:thymidylate synthase ThyX